MAAGGLVASTWSYIRNIYLYVKNALIVTVEVGGTGMSEAACHMILHDFKPTPFSKRSFVGAQTFIKSEGRTATIPFEMIGTHSVIFRSGWRMMLVSYWRWSEMCELSFIRGTFSVEEIMKKISARCDAALAGGNKRFNIRQLSGSIGVKPVDLSGMIGLMKKDDNGKGFCGNFTPSKYNSKPFGFESDDVGAAEYTAPVAKLALSADAMNAFGEAAYWKNNRNWYTAKGLPWKRGWLLYGAPGTGKTSFARAVAQELDLPIVVLNIGTMTNKDLFDAWKTVVQDTPCLVLIEDIDNVFNGRTNIVDGGDAAPLTFDCLLNVIDGVDINDGMFMIITTNHADKLDQAIGLPDSDGMTCRPGRIDRAILFDKLDESGMRKIAGRILSDCLHLVDGIVEAGLRHGDSGAQFQERCRKAAERIMTACAADDRLKNKIIR